MTARLIRTVAVLGLVATLVAAPATAWAAGIDRATSAVVAVTSGGNRIGSGVVVAPGYVLTAAHVIEAPLPLPALLIGNRQETFQVVADDPVRDLALLKTDTTGVTPIVFGDSNRLARGQQVIALGFSVGLASVSFTQGVIRSPLQRFAGRQFIQTDAAINPGDSGGPLVTTDGQLVGIAVGKVSEANVDSVGFAIPAADALDFIRAEQPGVPLSLAPALSTGQTAGIVIALIVVVVGAFLVPYLLLSRQAARRDREQKAAEVTPAARESHRRFHVAGPARDEAIDIRLPGVVGHADNADIRVADEGVVAYQARISIGPADAVTVLDLTDGDGFYCADQCVLEATIHPGESFRVGATTITLVERRT